MRTPLTVMATTAVVTTLAGATVAGCGSHSNTSTPASESSTATARPALSDYTTLLIKAADIKAPDAFTAGPATKDPNGNQGATITFTDQDKSHSIIDTIQILLDPEATANALDSAKAIHRESLRTKALNAEVGVGGVTISGLSEDHSKGVTVLLFTEGKALVTMEFDGPSYALAPPEFVTEVGQKQDEAIKKGLGG
ncbi:hypothetical protein [Mycobacterium sp.]|uniref:hypothetical protein n=1 Tax=Mycobacterium sp. TaxID=1785 RepID=UPI003BB0F7C6